MVPGRLCGGKLEVSVARVKTATRESVPAHQRDAFDEIVKQRGSVPDTGPGSIMMNAPEMLVRGGEPAGLPAGR